MKLAIMQPYFFPYPGYFQLLAQADLWVVFDHCQFVNKGWVNRNRILHPDPEKGWQYLTVPLSKRGRFDFIDQIDIDENADWRKSLVGKLTHYRAAPHYQEVMAVFKGALSYQGSRLSAFLVNSLRLLADYLGVKTRIVVYSELNLGVEKVVHSGQWALRISEALGATEYLNPIGGESLFDPLEFFEAGIELRFLETRIREYCQGPYDYVPNLSILDAMMWCDSDTLKSMLSEDFSIHSCSGAFNEC
ncbi:WbqC family protein [Marinobacter sp.]|uniref:WbqC family protein n=1 Tax=Marinobacter sp. TaxID=50741 RepID=UPI003A8D4B5F